MLCTRRLSTLAALLLLGLTAAESNAQADSDGDGLTDPVEAAYGTDPFSPDSDSGGTLDGVEVWLDGTDPLNPADDLPDSDGDGLSDFAETTLIGSDPNNPDTDGGGQSDGLEILAGNDPTFPLDDFSLTPNDTDGDGVPDNSEGDVYGTDFLLQDTDGDGLTDGEEAYLFGTDPTEFDTDNDGVSDFEELIIYGTNPFLSDTDGDGLTDSEELFVYGTNPSNSDTDGGGISDGEEVLNQGTDPLNPADDAQADSDGDGLTDIEETIGYGTDPFNPDTDSDGLLDGEEVFNYFTDPNNPDSDFDGLFDGSEVFFTGTNPNSSDTDADGLTDGEEVDNYNTDPLSPDSDGDGLSDPDEIFSFGTNPNNPDTDGDGLPDFDEIFFFGTDPINPDTDNGGVNDGDEIATGTDPFNPTDDFLFVDPCGFVNPSFESGDFTGWITQDLSTPHEPLRVDASTGYDQNGGFGFLWGTAATDGLYTAYHGFDGSGATDGYPISIAQDVTITEPGLSFDWRAAWDMLNYGSPGNLDRSFDVVIRPTGGGAELARYNVLVATGYTQNFDTGQTTTVVDLGAFLGSAVRVSFEWTVPEDFTGPGHFQLDNVCLGSPPCPADTNGDGILDNGDIITFVALFLAGDTAADMNADGILDNGDIIAFVSLFLAGC